MVHTEPTPSGREVAPTEPTAPSWKEVRNFLGRCDLLTVLALTGARKDDFEERLSEVLGGDYERIGWDDYDGSLEIYGVENHVRLSHACQQLILGGGFSKCFVNHHDGHETHYTWRDGKPIERGWRRFTREGGFDISYWPEAWTGAGTKDWLSSGYMRIVPDTLEYSATRDAVTLSDGTPLSSQDEDEAQPNGMNTKPFPSQEEG